MAQSERPRRTADEIFMEQAIALSAQAVRRGNEPFGAVLVRDGAVVFTNENQIYTAGDPTFHAEAGLLRYDVGVDANGMAPVSLDAVLSFFGL